MVLRPQLARRRLAALIGALGVLALGAFLASVLLEASAFEDLGSAITREVPSRIHAAPLRLTPGMPLGPKGLQQHLETTGYRAVAERPGTPGSFQRDGDRWHVFVRRFAHAEGEEAGGPLSIALSREGRVRALDGPGGRRLRSALLDPPVLWRLHDRDGRDRVPVALDALPAHLVDAVLAIEDQRFFEHPGIDPVRIAGAMLANLRAGRVVQGGSTLTQQLVKNRHLTRKRSWLRKLQEIPLALRLEALRSKREILQAYLNEVYLGQEGGVAIHGVGRGAEHWFGKPVAELDLHESALLAGLLRGPSLYSPRRDPEAARERRDLVLRAMLEQRRIAPEAFEAARAQELVVVPPRRVPVSARHFVDAITPKLRARLPAEALADHGLSIYTTLDLRLQTLAARAVAEGLARLERDMPSLQREGAPLQAALVALEPETGALRALVGGRDYRASQFDRALQARRQPGSVFKPVVLLAALAPEADGRPPYTLASVLEDDPLAVDTREGTWSPRNHDEAFHGDVSVREAIEHSLNVPMVQLGQALGPDAIVHAARRLGIASPLRPVPSLVLGTSEVSLLEMTRAYAVLAAEGHRAGLRDVLAVRDASGATLWHAEDRGEPALSPAEAHLVTSALRGVIERGTGHGVRVAGYRGPVAGKTGSTDGYRDAWFIGYTPELAVGVWVGFDDGTTLRHSGSGAALPIFAEFLKAALGPRGDRDFRVPRGVETVRVVPTDGHRAGVACGGEPEVFLAGTAPTERCNPWEWFARRNLFGRERMQARQVWEPTPEVGAAPQREGRPAWLRWLPPFEGTRR